jgi:hypothetical protein
MKNIIPRIKISKTDLYFVALALVILALIITNELGFGVITFAPLAILAYWLMTKAFGEDKSSS